MTKFAETDCEIREDGIGNVYAGCTARNCAWVGPPRQTEAAAKRDAVRHHEAS